jgi:hypothetical protein
MTKPAMKEVIVMARSKSSARRIRRVVSEIVKLGGSLWSWDNTTISK